MKTALVLACDDRFIPYTTVVARRIVRSAAEKFPIVVVSDGVSDDNKALAQRYCPRIGFIEASHLFAERPLPSAHASSRAYCLRLFLDEILADFDRAVYLDSDISVLADVSPLLSMVPNAGPVIAGYDLLGPPTLRHQVRLGMSEGAAYFNSGVLVCDLKAVRQERIFADAMTFALQNPDRCIHIDQDALNAVLDGRWQVLDWRWNALNYMSDRMPKQPFIRHFATSNKPWSRMKVGIQPRFVREWRSDLAESPWPGRFQEESLKYRIRNAFRPASARIERHAKSLIYAGSGGKRGIRVKLAEYHLEICSAIEQAAAAGARARPFAPFEESGAAL
jgi:lipopolysaccharide biosynthesis glycosyltransferase